MGVIIDWSESSKPDTRVVAQRMVLLEDAGFGDAQVEFMKYMRLTPHTVIDDFGKERKSDAMYKLYRDQKITRNKLAVELGISREKAAAILRAEANKASRDWQDQYTGLPPEYDPIVLMGYAETTRKYA